MVVPELDAKIIYCVIAHPRHSIIAQHAYLSGSYHDATTSLLPTIPYDIPETKRCYQFDEFMYYYLVNEHKTTFLCLTDASFSKLQAFKFLHDVRLSFEEEVPLSDLNEMHFPTVKYARRLKQMLKRKTSYYNDNPEADKIKLASQQIEEVKVEMLKNIDKALNVGKATDLLASETTFMEENSRRFRNFSRRMRNKVIFNNICLIIAIIAIILIIFFIVTSFLCGVKCISWIWTSRK